MCGTRHTPVSDRRGLVRLTNVSPLTEVTGEGPRAWAVLRGLIASRRTWNVRRRSRAIDRSGSLRRRGFARTEPGTRCRLRGRDV